MVGRTIGRLQIRGLLGSGNMGEVYLAFDEKLEREVAVKVVRGLPTEKNRKRLAREARLLSQLDHPNICRLHELIEKPELDLLVLERIHGRSLDQVPPRTLPLRERLRIAQEIANALVAAHEKGVIHRDLKPSNVMVTDRGEVKVLDFGLAKSEGDSSRQDETVGRQGTFAYMSPEQVRGEQETAAGDIFSFGLLLQELLTGHPAYPRNLPWAQLLARVSRGETEPVFASVEPGLQQLLRRMLAHPPEARPSAVEVVSYLERLRDRPRRQRRRGVIAALVLALVAGFAKYTWDLQRERHAAAASTLEADAVAAFWVDLLAGNSTTPAAWNDQTQLGVVLDRAAEQLDGADWRHRPVLRARLLVTLGRIYRQIGALPKAERVLETAVQLHRQEQQDLALAETLEELAYTQLAAGKRTESEQHVREALAVLGRLPGSPTSKRIQSQLEKLARTSQPAPSP